MKIKWKIILSSVCAIVILAMSLLIVNYVSTSNLVNSKTDEELENYSNMGMKLLNFVYQGDWTLKDGKLYKGKTLLNENYKIIDQFTDKSEVLATLFANDTRISTNVVNDKNERQINTKASKEVIEKVINKGENYSGVADIQGKSARTYYCPLRDKDGNVIGMWFVGVYTDNEMETISKSRNTIVFIAVLMILICGSVTSYIGQSISKGIEEIEHNFLKMEKGDFKSHINPKLMSKKDEIGVIARSCKNMQIKIAEVINEIQQESDNVIASTETSVESIGQINEEIETISATTEELSAGMEETTASTQEMNASVEKIVLEISGMKEKTVNGENLVEVIKDRAENIKGETHKSQQSAINLYEKTNKQLRDSIEKTKAISEIQELSKTILDITSQTNHLALNAAIEAARAGEAGKGFAVVAEQIRVLAENSKQAVARINDITDNVSEAVESVVKDSNGLLQFVDNQVLPDYKSFVEIGTQYDSDADNVHEIVSDIATGTEELYITIQQISRAINEISIATNEGAEGTTDIAGKISEIVSKANTVLNESKIGDESIRKLDEVAEFFSV